MEVSIFLHHLTILAFCLESVFGDSCATLDGVWYNQLGSEMILTHTRQGELLGEYRIAVERETGAAGYAHSKVVGAAPYDKPGAAFGFAVMFNRGSSITAWTGQCLVCDGVEVLVTSWLLRTRVDTCWDKWRSTPIGQDTFTRAEQMSGPLKYLNIHSPRNGGYEHNDVERHRRESVSNSPGPEGPQGIPCALEGTWYNEMGSEVILHHSPDDHISGEYRTAVERDSGAAGTTHSQVYGLGDVYSGETTFALFVVWRNGESVTGWVGQCHQCGYDYKNKTGSILSESLEVNWLLRQRVASCDDNWKATFYGQNSFTRHEQKQGPRKKLGIHTPQQEGEDDLDPGSQPRVTCSGVQLSEQTWLPLCLLCLTRLILYT